MTATTRVTITIENANGAVTFVRSQPLDKLSMPVESPRDTLKHVITDATAWLRRNEKPPAGRGIRQVR